MSKIDLILTLAGLLMSLMVFSYFLDDKLLFGLAMVSLVGISAGFAVLVLEREFRNSRVNRFLDLFPIYHFPDDIRFANIREFFILAAGQQGCQDD